MDKLAHWILAAAVFLAPWGSVGVTEVLLGRSIGVGVQPAVPFLGLLILATGMSALRDRSLRRGETAVTVALLWTAAAAALTWSIPDMGLAGQQPWAKATRQLAQWGFFVVAALAVSRTVEGGIGAAVERALSGGLLLAAAAAIAVGLGLTDGAGLLDTNPSIASGSAELYLGHSFTGIARLRAPMPEPLLLGSYLLAAVPLVLLSALSRTGSARAWRLLAVGLGALCLAGTWSRGAWLGAAATAILLVVSWSRGLLGPVRRRAVIGACAGAGLAGVIALSVVLQVTPREVPGLLWQRVGQSLADHDMSNMTRVWAWRAALAMFADAPLTGQGWGSFGFLFFGHASAAASSAHFGWPVPNHLGLLVLAESGLLGLGTWCAALVPPLRVLVRRDAPVSAIFVAAALGGVLVQFSTFSQWNLPHLWLLFGVGLGLARRASDGMAQP